MLGSVDPAGHGKVQVQELSQQVFPRRESVGGEHGAVERGVVVLLT